MVVSDGNCVVLGAKVKHSVTWYGPCVHVPLDSCALSITMPCATPHYDAGFGFATLSITMLAVASLLKWGLGHFFKSFERLLRCFHVR